MATAAILTKFLKLCNTYVGIIYTYKAMYMKLSIGQGIGTQSELQVVDDHNACVVIVIKAEYIDGHALKATTCHHLLLPN